MLGDKRKPRTRQRQIVGFADGSTENIVQFIVDGNDVVATGKGTLQKIQRYGDNLTMRP